MEQEKWLKVFNVVWNDPNYQNDWFEVGSWDIDEDVDVEEQILIQEDDCNEAEGRDDLEILSYDFEFYYE